MTKGQLLEPALSCDIMAKQLYMHTWPEPIFYQLLDSHFAPLALNLCLNKAYLGSVRLELILFWSLIWVENIHMKICNKKCPGIIFIWIWPHMELWIIPELWNCIALTAMESELHCTDMPLSAFSLHPVQLVQYATSTFYGDLCETMLWLRAEHGTCRVKGEGRMKAVEL